MRRRSIVSAVVRLCAAITHPFQMVKLWKPSRMLLLSLVGLEVLMLANVDEESKSVVTQVKECMIDSVLAIY